VALAPLDGPTRPIFRLIRAGCCLYVAPLEEFRTVESIPSDPISQNISTYKMLALNLPCI
jgi:hypothetical protein